MKKLEDFNSEIFQISKKRMKNVKGAKTGIGINFTSLVDGIDYSYEYKTTQLPNRLPKTDPKAWDICWDF